MRAYGARINKCTTKEEEECACVQSVWQSFVRHHYMHKREAFNLKKKKGMCK